MSTVHELAASLSPRGWVLVVVAVLGLLTGRRHRSRRRRRYATNRRARRILASGERREFSAEQRAQMLARDGGCCRYCGVAVHYETNCQWVDGCDTCFEADHYVPWSQGGQTILANGVTSCRYHNRLKSDRDPDEFLAAAPR